MSQDDGRIQAVQQVLTDVIRLMEMPLRVEVKGVEDGSIAAALFPDGEVAGFSPGKKSPVMEALQFLVNKVVNPPTAQRRWVALGVGEFPPPRSPSPAPMHGARAVAGDGASMSVPRAAPAPRSHPAAPASPAEERTMEVPIDPLLAAVGESLAEKSSRLGRFYAVLGLSAEDRARIFQAASSVLGVSLATEGEGRHRRLVFRPD